MESVSSERKLTSEGRDSLELERGRLMLRCGVCGTVKKLDDDGRDGDGSEVVVVEEAVDDSVDDADAEEADL